MTLLKIDIGKKAEKQNRFQLSHEKKTALLSIILVV